MSDMKYRIMKNELGSYRIQYRHRLWFLWSTESKYAGPFLLSMPILFNTLNEAKAHVELMKHDAELDRRSRMWKKVWP